MDNTVQTSILFYIEIHTILSDYTVRKLKEHLVKNGYLKTHSIQ